MIKRDLYSKKNVRGISLDDDSGECRVYVERKEDENKLEGEDIVPEYFDGYKTDVLEIGDVSPIIPTARRTKRFNVLQPGVSIGHYQYTTAGSLGVFVEKDNELYFLTNAHVGAGSNKAEPEDPILQPGPTDGGQEVKDRIGELVHYFKLKDGMKWDAALAKHIDRDVNLKPKGLSNTPRIVESPNVGDKVITTGRTQPSISTSKVIDKGVDIQVRYGSDTCEVLKTNMYEPFIQGGDSGSGIFKDSGEALVDIAFAGSDKVSFGIGNIEGLFNHYNIKLAKGDYDV